MNGSETGPVSVGRRAVVLIAGAGVVALTLSACGGSSGSSKPGTQRVVSGGTFTFALNSDPGSLDPQASAASNLYQMSFLAYDPLLSVDGKGAIRSELASKWSVAGKTVTLTLNKGITCSDGSAFTAATAAANINYVASPKSKSPFTGVFIPAGAKATADTAAGTVTVTLPATAPFILNGLAGVPMVCAKGMADRSMLAKRTDGTGAYALTSSTPNDQYVLAKRTGYTWGPSGATTAAKGLPDKIVVKVVPNATTAANLLLAGQLNAAAVLGPDATRLEAAKLFSESTQSVSGEMWFNHNKGRITLDRQVRLALTRALDFTDLQKVLTSGRGAAGTSFAATAPVACPGNSVADALPGHDLTAAKALLDADGWTAGSGGVRTKGGRPLAVNLLYTTALGTGGSSAAELAAQQWRKLGVKVTITAQDDTAETNTLFTTGNWDVAWAPLNVSSPDQIVGFASGAAPPKGTNFAHISNSAYDAGVAAAQKLQGQASCGTWLKAEANLVSGADAIPFANQVIKTFGKKATFEVVGELLPTSIRMTG